jgi:DNA/RNA endonuclease YhcR with UshA esterase domain
MIWTTQAATGKNWEVTSAMNEMGKVTTVATAAAALEAEQARRRSQETLGEASGMVVPEVTVKMEVVLAAENLEEHELHLHTNSW